MSFNAWSAYLELEWKDKWALKMLDQVEKKTWTIQKGLSWLTKAFIALCWALVVKDIVSTYAKFEQSVANAASVTWKFWAELTKVKQNISWVAKELWKRTVFSANEAADALYDLASAWEDVANITTKDIKPILDLAAATGTDLPAAMEQTLAAMKQMGWTFEDVWAITDSLMATIASSPANMSRLREAWKQAAPIANTLWVWFNELNASLGTLFGKWFLQWEQAGTALRNMFTRLVPSTQAQVDNLTALWLSTEDVSVENLGLLKVLSNLKIAYNWLWTQEEKVAAAKKMFWEEAAGAAIALIDEADAVQKLYDNMELMKQKAEESWKSLTEMVADLQLDTLQGSLKLFQSNLESLKIAIWEVLAPMIRIIAELLWSITANEWVQKFIQGIFLVLADTIRWIVEVFVAWKTAIDETFWWESQTLLDWFYRWLEIVWNVIKLVLWYITDLWILAIKTFKKITDFVKEKWGWDLTTIMKDWWTYTQAILWAIIVIFTATFNKIVDLWNKFSPFFIQLFDWIIKFAKWFLQILTWNFSEWFTNIWDGIVAFAAWTIKIIWWALSEIWWFITKLAWFLWRTFLKLAVWIWALWLDLVESAANVFTIIVRNAAVFILNLFNTTTDIDWGEVWSWMQEWFWKAIDNIINKAKEIWKKIADFFKNIFAWDEKADINVWTTLWKLSSWDKKKILSEYENVFDWMNFSRTEKVFASIWNDFKDTFLDVDTSKIADAASDVKAKILATNKLANWNTLEEQQSIVDTLNTQNQITEELTTNTNNQTNAVKSGWAASKGKNEEEEKANKKALEDYWKITDKIKDSIKRIQKYWDNLKDLREKFSELKRSAKSDIQELTSSIWELDKKMADITSAWEKERAWIQSDADIKLAERRLDILDRQKEIEKEIDDLRKDWYEWDEYQKELDLKKENKSLQEELALISKNVSDETIKQVEDYNSMSESARTLLDLQTQLTDQKKKEADEISRIQEEKALLEEKKAISEAILKDRNIRIQEEWDVLTAFYTDAEWKEVAIKDFKNIQYAQDLENKRLALQNQILAVEEWALAEKEILSTLYEEKTTMEQTFTEVLAEEKAKQTEIIEAEIAETKKAIKIWNEYWKARRSWNWSVSVNDSWSFAWYASGWYTWNIWTKQVAWVVHGQEYVIPANVMKKIAWTWILEWLEKMRRWFSNGWYTSQVPSVSNVNSPSLNVTQNISSWLDFNWAIREMSYLLRLSS